MKSNRVFLSHILAEANFLIERTRTLAFAEFAADDVITRACTRSVEIIGEAVKNLSAEFRKTHGHVEWQRIAGMRDRLIHGYFDVDLVILWDVIRHRIPELKEHVGWSGPYSSGHMTNTCTRIQPTNETDELGLIWGFRPRVARIGRNERVGFSEETQEVA